MAYGEFYVDRLCLQTAKATLLSLLVHPITHDAYKVSLKQSHSTSFPFRASFNGLFCCLPVTVGAFGFLAFKINNSNTQTVLHLLDQKKKRMIK